jgi:hypothetical protein
MDVEPCIRQGLRYEAGAHQVANAQQMLDIDHDSWHVPSLVTIRKE